MSNPKADAVVIVSRICYTVCLISVVAGMCLGLLLIWTEMPDELGWRGLMTCVTLLLGSGVILSVTRVMMKSDGG